MCSSLREAKLIIKLSDEPTHRSSLYIPENLGGPSAPLALRRPIILRRLLLGGAFRGSLGLRLRFSVLLVVLLRAPAVRSV